MLSCHHLTTFKPIYNTLPPTKLQFISWAKIISCFHQHHHNLFTSTIINSIAATTYLFIRSTHTNTPPLICRVGDYLSYFFSLCHRSTSRHSIHPSKFFCVNILAAHHMLMASAQCHRLSHFAEHKIQIVHVSFFVCTCGSFAAKSLENC